MSETQVIERPAERINSYHKAEIIEQLVKEVPQREIAKQFNARQPNISVIKKQNQALIDQKKSELLKLLPSVIDSVTDDVFANKLLSKRIRMNPYNVDSEKIALKNTLNKTNDTILKIASHEGVGILPSRAPLININQDNRIQKTVISDNVLNLFGNHAHDLIEAEVVDANGDTTNDG